MLPLFGVIGHRMGSFDDISGGTSTERFVARLDELLADDQIETIVLDVDSPGGTVFGVPEAAERLFDARGEKRVIAVANAQMASAAYHIGAAADEVVVTPSGEVGSIGVFAIHTEISRAEEEAGITRTILRAGEFKAEANPHEPLTDEARDHIQESVDDFYGLFVDAVARYRGTTPAAVRRGYGRGRALTAQRALEAGLVDRVASLDEVLADLGVRMSHARASRAARSAMEEIDKAPRGELVALEAVDPTPATGPHPNVDWAETLSRWIDDPRVSLRDSRRPTIAYFGRAEDDAEEGQDPDDDQDQDADENGHDPDAAEGGADRDTEPDAPTSTPPAGKERTVDPESTAAQTGAVKGDGLDVSVGDDAMEAERKRAADITQLCHAHDMGERASEWIGAGHSADLVGRKILELKERERPGSTLPEAKPPVELTEEENQEYSIRRLIMAAADGKHDRAGFEMEIHDELSQKLNHSPKGIMVPTNLGVSREVYRKQDLDAVGYRSQLTTQTTGGGEELVFVEPGSFIDLLRSRMVTTQMGATFLPGLRGNVDFPKQTGAGEFSWVDEEAGSDTPGDSDADTALVQLRAKNGRSITSFSRTLLAQSVVNVEQLVRRDLSAIGSRGLDQAALHGTGASNQPTGIYSASGVHPVAFDGTIDYPKVVKMETKIAEADADVDRMGYVGTPGVRGAAKTTLTFPDANTGAPIWTGGVRDGEMNGFNAMASTQVKKDLGAGSEHGLIFGAWEHLLIGEWGAMDLLVDPFTRGGRGLIRVILFLIADVALRYPEAFSKATGLTVATDGS
ncbi:MAG: phage major capsid protein [Myxococcota bacterium]